MILVQMLVSIPTIFLGLFQTCTGFSYSFYYGVFEILKHFRSKNNKLYCKLKRLPTT